MRWLIGALVTVACGRSNVLPAGANEVPVQDGGGCLSGGWTVETVAASTSGDAAVPSIALGPNGEVHIGWAFLQGPVQHAQRGRGGVWSLDTVAPSPGSLIVYLSLAVDASGVAYLMYGAEDTAQIMLSTSTPEGWTTATVKEEAYLGDFTIDASGTLHATYYIAEQGTWTMRHAWRDNGVWLVSDVDTNVSWSSSIATDADGGVHIAYQAGEMRNLRYAYRQAEGVWATQTVDATEHEWSGETIALAIDGTGVLHLVYTRRCGGDDCEPPSATLAYARRAPGGAWVLEDVVGDHNNWAFGSSSIAVEDSGVVHAGYCWYGGGTQAGRLHYARRGENGSWTTELVADEGCGGIALALDDSRTVHVAFYDDVNAELRYAQRCP
jgi:hypothetical protein